MKKRSKRRVVAPLPPCMAIWKERLELECAIWREAANAMKIIAGISVIDLAVCCTLKVMKSFK